MKIASAGSRLTGVETVDGFGVGATLSALVFSYQEGQADHQGLLFL
jgi:hypothetical protein